MNLRFIKILSLFLFVPLCNAVILSQVIGDNPQSVVRIRLGYNSIIFQDADPKDANAAFIVYVKILQKMLLTKFNLKSELTSVLFESSQALEEALAKREIDIIGLTSLDYFSMKDKYNLAPALAGFIDKDIYSHYILIVRNDSGINRLEDLFQKSLALPPAKRNPFIDVWLTNILAGQKKTERDSFFDKIKVEEKETNAIYSVFFKKSDCAIILRRTFDVVASLNPQVKNSFKIIDTTPDLVLSFAAYRKDTDTAYVKMYIDVAKETHLTPEGNNILKIFKSKKLVDLTEKELASTKLVIDSYNKLLKKRKR